MDTKKLIGTIIGVIAFVALIASATFAWLTSSLNVENGVYNTGSMNFSVNFVKGTDVTNVPILGTATKTTARELYVTANKVAGSAPGTLSIKLNTTSNNTLTTSGALHYAICVGECASNFAGATTGTVTATGEKTILTTPLTDSATSYYVYFWLDGATVTNSHVGQQYSGFISASAVQTAS